MIDEKDHAKRGLDLAYPLRLLVGGAFIIIVALTLIQVFFRSVLDSPLIWSEEVVRLLLVWVFLPSGIKQDREGVYEDGKYSIGTEQEQP